MKIAPIHAPSAQGPDPGAAAREVQAKPLAGAIDGKTAIDPEKLRLAREFEQIFIRKMLSSLEKSGRSMAGSSASSSGDAYGSMVVSALAEAVSKGGGIGLAEVIARAASQEALGTTAAAPVATTAAAADSSATTRAGGAREIGAGTAPITAAQPPGVTLSPAPTTVTYPRPTPSIILNENHDIHESFKDRNR
jgi:Rod binding domain-containing protein